MANKKLEVRLVKKAAKTTVKAPKAKGSAEYQARLEKLEAEFDEVAGRYDRLRAALERGDTFRVQVGNDQYDLLIKQAAAMMTYRNILAVRIELFRRGGSNG